MKINRRKWAEMVGGSAVAAKALAQVPVPAAEPDLLQTARDNNKRVSDALAKYEIPLLAEPAFQFKA
jgi:hypothetical protein